MVEIEAQKSRNASDANEECMQAVLERFGIREIGQSPPRRETAPAKGGQEEDEGIGLVAGGATGIRSDTQESNSSLNIGCSSDQKAGDAEGQNDEVHLERPGIEVDDAGWNVGGGGRSYPDSEALEKCAAGKLEHCGFLEMGGGGCDEEGGGGCDEEGEEERGRGGVRCVLCQRWDCALRGQSNRSILPMRPLQRP